MVKKALPIMTIKAITAIMGGVMSDARCFALYEFDGIGDMGIHRLVVVYIGDNGAVFGDKSLYGR